ncbi:MAG: response regulator [Kiritimatiellae bacterium]|nr:response regulator [Kiritimatiellia bacterium]
MPNDPRIPQGGRAGAPGQSQAKGQGGGPPVTAVIVDDSEATRDLLAFILEPTPIEVVGQAANAQDAIDMCTAMQPDLLFLDIVMPGMSGTEALVLIKQMVPDVKVVVLTSVSDRNTVLRAKQFGAYDYILKPFEREELKKTVGLIYQKILKERG